ncbi:MAG: hypothetical protein ISN28_13210 [Ectothiorhodospiraceae bacterium AqS1]|nr:hypothetical protein [Ectothiorhodospiraceae bacterium AqS1]
MTLPSRLSIFVLLGSLFALFVLGSSALAQTIVLDDTATLTIEEGETGEFNVKLSVQPDAQVTVTLTSDDDDVTLDPT